MWYFSWILGLGLAATVGILNALWYELRQTRATADALAEEILDMQPQEPQGVLRRQDSPGLKQSPLGTPGH